MSDTFLYVIVGLVFYQAYVTIRVVREKSLAPERKRRQILLVWLIPFLGAAMALAALAADQGKDSAPQEPKK